MNKTILLVLAGLLLGGCSLFKFSVSTGDTPLPKDQLELRMMTRGLGSEFNAAVIGAADSILAAASDPQVRIRALRWKLGATSAAASAALQTAPEVALLDLWIFACRMDAYLAQAPDSLLFGEASAPARETGRQMLQRTQRMAREHLNHNRYELMHAFVTAYCLDHPADKPEFGNSDRLLAWTDYLRENGQEYTVAVGSVSEVMADMSDRMSAATRRFTDGIAWSKEILELQLRQDSVRDRLTARLDSLSYDFSRMVAVAEHTPEIFDYLGDSFTRQFEELIATVNDGVDNAFANIDRQRTEIEHFLARQQREVMAEARSAAEQVVRDTLDGLPALVRSILLWIILFVVVLFSIPFTLGFLLGRVRRRKKEAAQPDDDKY